MYFVKSYASGCNLWKFIANCLPDAHGCIFKQVGGNGHLSFNEFYYPSVIDGVVHVVGLHGPAGIESEIYIQFKHIAHTAFLWQDTVAGM